MATERDHIALANHNHEVLLHLLGDGRFLDWAATVAFYKAVHVVEAAFANDFAFHSTSHSDREKTLKAARYKGVFTNYVHLLTASRVGRYLESSDAGAFSTFADYMDAAAVKKLVTVRLYRVEQNALVFLSTQGRSNLIKTDPGRI